MVEASDEPYILLLDANIFVVHQMCKTSNSRVGRSRSYQLPQDVQNLLSENDFVRTRRRCFPLDALTRYVRRSSRSDQLPRRVVPASPDWRYVPITALSGIFNLDLIPSGEG